jgi:hypothetical protein
LCSLAEKDTISGLFRNMASVFKFGRDLEASCSNAVHAEAGQALMKSPFLGGAAISGRACQARGDEGRAATAGVGQYARRRRGVSLSQMHMPALVERKIDIDGDRLGTDRCPFEVQAV